MQKSVIGACVFFCAIAASSALAAASATKPSIQQQTPPYSQEPLEIQSNSLGANFKGVSCRELVTKIKKINIRKDEFETSTEYAERTEHVRSDVILGSYTGASIMAFVPSGGLVSTSYNADTGILKVTAPTVGSITTKINSEYIKSAVIENDVKKIDKYEASNAYGKKVLVEKGTFSICALAFKNIPTLGYSQKIPRDFSISLPPDEARKNKDNVGILYVTRLESPFLIDYTAYNKPTIDYPVESISTGDAIVVSLSQIWIFNRSTGDILQKLGM